MLSQKSTKEEHDFLKKLISFMDKRNTPIERPPMLGFKQSKSYFDDHFMMYLRTLYIKQPYIFFKILIHHSHFSWFARIFRESCQIGWLWWLCSWESMEIYLRWTWRKSPEYKRRHLHSTSLWKVFHKNHIMIKIWKDKKERIAIDKVSIFHWS